MFTPDKSFSKTVKKKKPVRSTGSFVDLDQCNNLTDPYGKKKKKTTEMGLNNKH